jgi:type II secretory pathway predicted ATPase ExeA
VTDSPDPSGVGEHMMTLATALRDEVRIGLIFSDSGSGKALACRGRTAGLDTCTVPAQSLVEGGAGLIEVLEAWRPDILHIHAGIAGQRYAPNWTSSTIP